MKKRIRKFVVLFFSLCLVSGLCLPVLAQTEEAAAGSWAEEIPAMLAAGNFAEGQVVAGVMSYGKTVSADELLAGSDEIMEVSEEASSGGLFTKQEEMQIVYIQREDMSTEEILYRLSENRNVLFAEPNYLSDASEYALDSLTEMSTGDPDSKVTVRTENIADLTGLQWGNQDSGSLHLEGNENTSMHVPEYGATGSNMSGDPVVVAVFDDALDYQNPDLTNVIYRFSPQQQAVLGCGEWGYNATMQSTDGVPVYFDGQYHGSHCGGIIGAEWDGKGLSGVASNVELVSVQILVEDGLTSLVNCLRGFDFIDRANEAGCNISLLSCSFAMIQESRAMDAAIRALGEKWGVVCIMAAGNDDRELSIIGETPGTLLDNPYAVIVAATDSSGEKAPYSNFGKTTVDLGAPGSGILSTVTLAQSQYFPDAVPDTNKFYEGFEGETSQVQVTQVSQENEPAAAVVSVTEASRFSGEHGLKVELDPSCELQDLGFGDIYNLCLQMDFGDVSAMGVGPGDLLGFAVGSKGFIQIGNANYTDAVTGDNATLMREFNATSNANSWINIYYTVPENIDLTHFQITANLVVSQGTDTVYLDSFGFGTEKVPYAFLDGTSMAAPGVCGAAAVLKAANPGLKGEELVSVIKSTVCQTEGLSELTKTGGRLDFEAQAERAEAPVIQELSVSGQTVRISGSGFSDSGTVRVTKEVAGKDPEEWPAEVSSWTDSLVELSFGEEFTGVMQVVLENSGGEQDAAIRFISKSGNIYEEDLPFETDTGEPFVFDAPGDLETNGPLVGLEDQLYYLPPVMMVEGTNAYRSMFCYDISDQTWQELPELPEWLQYLSAVMYEGKIVVKGSSMETGPDGSPYSAMDSEVKIYVYDPGEKSWSAASSEGVDALDSIANMEGQLILAGGGGLEWDEAAGEDVDKPATVRTYDLETGAGEHLADLHRMLFRPQVVAKDGILYVLDLNSYTIERVENGTSQVLENALPEYLGTGYRSIKDELEGTERDGVLVPVSEGVVFAGPAAADGSGDTFLLRDGSDKFEPYEKRMSDCKASFVAAASYRGRLYALGCALYEPEQRFFRATAMDVPEYAGDMGLSGGGGEPSGSGEASSPEKESAGGTGSKISPKTGEESPVLVWVLLMAAGVAGAAAFGTVFACRSRR